MTDWIRIASTADCPPGSAVELVTGGRVIAIFNVEGRYYALDGICPHQGGPLGKGKLCGRIVTCPWHGWQFDVATGKHQVNDCLQHPSFPVKVEGDGVFIRVGSVA